MSYIFDTITEVITELKNSPDIVIDELLINPPANATSLEAESKIPSILKELYAKADGLVLSWSYRNDPLVKGGIVIPLLENIHNTRWKAFAMLDYTDDVHVFFNKRGTDDARVVQESLEGDEDVEFVDIAGGIVTIKSYFEAFRKTRGFRFWQENYNPDTEYTVDSIIENRCYLWGSSGEETEIEFHSAHVPN